MSHQDTAAEWRATQPEPYASTGVALIWGGEVYGWKNELRDAQHERPQAVAVDVAGHAYRAEGGDDYNGAAGWVAIA